jgi:signal transduction histidine kinase
MNARLLRSSDRDRARTIAARIVSSGERMTRMIDQILDWTRMRSDAGHVRVVCADCDLAAVTEAVVGEHRARAGDVPIAVEARGTLRGNWDADRLAQALSNLVGNAVDHASKPGVRVHLDGAGDEVSISVENDGRIDDDVLPVIFEPFRGRASGSKLRGRGLGLGLYITRQIVLAHGGRIDVLQPAGERVVFAVQLPRDAG